MCRYGARKSFLNILCLRCSKSHPQNQQHCWHRDPSSTHWVGICLLNQKCKRPHCLLDFKMEREHQGTSLPSLVPFHPRTSKLLNKIWGPLPSGLCPPPQIHLLGLSLQSFECSHGGFLRWADQVTWPSDPWLGTYSTELHHLIESSVIP